MEMNEVLQELQEQSCCSKSNACNYRITRITFRQGTILKEQVKIGWNGVIKVLDGAGIDIHALLFCHL